MPIPQEKNFLWDGHLARPRYFCKRSIVADSRKFVGFLSRNAVSPVLLRRVQDVRLTALHKLLFINLSQVINFSREIVY
ncbi:hypothetical protein QUB70_22825 [Microcoleus sp. A003_D6]